MTNAPYTNADNTPEMIDRAWEFASSARVCMLTTWDGERQHARPMTSHVEREEHAIYFLTKDDSAKEAELNRFPMCSLAYMETGKNKYLTIAGTASISNDRAKIKELWSPFYKVWWDSENDPTIRLVVFEPENAELWDGPNAVVATGIMLTAAITGTKPNLGNNAKVAM